MKNHVKYKLTWCSRHDDLIEMPTQASDKNVYKYCSKCLEDPINTKRKLFVAPYWQSPATLYYIYLPESKLYKIGITSNSVSTRFGNCQQDYTKVEELATWQYSTRVQAYEAEQLILKKFRESLYTGAPVLESGNTELFVTDVLGEHTVNKVKEILENKARRLGFELSDLQ